jgi:2,4-dienoyl-CoA reductase (NADPH2)
VQTRNRMVKNAAGMSYTDGKGDVRAPSVAFYEALAKGGAGLINVETCCVDYPLGVDEPVRLHLIDDKCIPNFSQLPEVIHKYGCPTFLQLVHAGNWHNSKFSGLQPVSSSSLTEKEAKERVKMFFAPRGLTIPEVEDIIDKFASSAVRAQKAGFDGVEINAATNHLVNSFLSRVWNKRQDAYGCQTLESRSRFLVEIIREIKKRLGQDFPVCALINGMEYGRKEGTTIEEAQEFARILQEAGADAINVRNYSFDPFYDGIRTIFTEEAFYPEPLKPMPKPYDWSHKGEGALLPIAAAIKQAVSIPIIAIGRLGPEIGERALREGKADFIGMVRRLIADPELPNKVISGRLEDIAPCTACFECRRVDRWVAAKGSVCRINAAVGGLQPYEVKKAEKKKKVVVVGGGPAGMEAARVAALRGHEVVLYEKESKLGGLLPLAALVKGLDVEDLVGIVRYLRTQITKLGVKVRLGKEFNLSIIEEIKPDAVILALGGIPDVLKIPGINRRNVVSNRDLHKQLKFFLKFFGVQTLRWLTNNRRRDTGRRAG